MVAKIFWTKNILSQNIFWSKKIFQTFFHLFLNMNALWIIAKVYLEPKMFWVQKKVWSNKIIQISFNLSFMCFERDWFVNHSLGIKEIWDKKHFGSKNILIQTNVQKKNLNLFWICQECVLKMNVFLINA